MAMFGKAFKNQVMPGDQPAMQMPSPMGGAQSPKWADALMTIGALMSDVGGGQGPQYSMALAKQRKEQALLANKMAAQQQLSGLFGGQAAGQGVASGGAIGSMPNIRDPKVQQALIAAENAGVDVGTILKMMDMGRPKWNVDSGSGTAYDENAAASPGVFARPTVLGDQLINASDPNNINRVASKAPVAGAVPGQIDQQGNVLTWRMPGETANAIAAASGAETAGKRNETFYSVPQEDGSTAFVTGGQFLGRGGGGGGYGAGPAGAPRLGVSQNPGQRKAQELDFTAGATAISGAAEAGAKAEGNARNSTQAFNDILALNPNDATGFQLGIAKALRSIGITNPNMEQFVNTADGYRMLTTQMVLPMAKELGSNPSNRDAKIIQDSMPGLRTPRQAGAVMFAMQAATANKEAARQRFYGGYTGEQSKSALTRAWGGTPEAKRSIFQDPIFERLMLDGHPAVTYSERNGKRYGVFHPYKADGSINPGAQVFEVF